MITSKCERCGVDVGSGNETEVRKAEYEHHMFSVEGANEYYPHECREFIRRVGNRPIARICFSGGCYCGTMPVEDIFTRRLEDVIA